jgi:hypothetical protein
MPPRFLAGSFPLGSSGVEDAAVAQTSVAAAVCKAE